MEHETYVSPEVANLLEKAGFDWACRKCYNNGMLFDMEADEIRTQVPQHSSYDVLAPTLEVAQRWLREVKKVHIEASPENDEYTEWLVCVYDSNHTAYSGYKTYEEALEAGIKKALEMILKKGG